MISLTLRPQLYKVSRIALFLSPSGLLKSTAVINWLISDSDNVSGSFLPIFGASIKSVGLDSLYFSKIK